MVKIRLGPVRGSGRAFSTHFPSKVSTFVAFTFGRCRGNARRDDFGLEVTGPKVNECQ
jgi:hypothetical protein